MLTELRIRNFKAWRDTGDLRLAPLTVVFGANSSGKSSLGHLLLGLKQTAQLTDRRRAFYLGDPYSAVDLGSFRDCLYDHRLDAELAFNLAWKLPEPLQLSNPIAAGEHYHGDRLRLEAALRADARDLPRLKSFRYSLEQDTQPQLQASHGLDAQGQAFLEVSPLKLVPRQGPQWALDAPEKFYRFSEVSLARYQNADSLSQFSLATERLLADLISLGPLREPPQRSYPWAGDIVPDVGPRGEFTVAAILAATEEGRMLRRRPQEDKLRFDAFIASWLKDLGIIIDFELRPITSVRKEYEVLVRTHQGAPQVSLTDVGFGVSQILPALVQAFYAPPHSTVWMEQPEIHLHPQVQAELADVFISAVQAHENGQPRRVQLIVESHSEHFLLRLQRRIAEGLISADEVAVYFANRRPDQLSLEHLRLDAEGNIENWPHNFFGDEMAELAARTRAALKRRRQGSGDAQ